MAKIKDLTGEIFNNLTVLEYSHKNRWGNSVWICKCTCGNTHVVSSGDLKSGRVKSCGCALKLHCISISKDNKKHNTFIKLDKDTTLMKDIKGNECLVDTYRVKDLKKVYWFKNSIGYWTNCNNQLLHRYIKGNPEGKIVDHINRDKNDNRDLMLRVGDYYDNNRNMPVKSNKKDKDLPIGVTRCNGRFRVTIKRYNISKSCIVPTLEEAVNLRASWEKLYN